MHKADFWKLQLPSACWVLIQTLLLLLLAYVIAAYRDVDLSDEGMYLYDAWATYRENTLRTLPLTRNYGYITGLPYLLFDQPPILMIRLYSMLIWAGGFALLFYGYARFFQQKALIFPALGYTIYALKIPVLGFQTLPVTCFAMAGGCYLLTKDWDPPGRQFLAGVLISMLLGLAVLSYTPSLLPAALVGMGACCLRRRRSFLSGMLVSCGLALLLLVWLTPIRPDTLLEGLRNSPYLQMYGLSRTDQLYGGERQVVEWLYSIQWIHALMGQEQLPVHWGLLLVVRILTKSILLFQSYGSALLVGSLLAIGVMTFRRFPSNMTQYPRIYPTCMLAALFLLLLWLTGKTFLINLMTGGLLSLLGLQLLHWRENKAIQHALYLLILLLFFYGVAKALMVSPAVKTVLLGAMAGLFTFLGLSGMVRWLGRKTTYPVILSLLALSFIWLWVNLFFWNPKLPYMVYFVDFFNHTFDTVSFYWRRSFRFIWIAVALIPILAGVLYRLKESIHHFLFPLFGLLALGLTQEYFGGNPHSFYLSSLTPGFFGVAWIILIAAASRLNWPQVARYSIHSVFGLLLVFAVLFSLTWSYRGYGAWHNRMQPVSAQVPALWGLHLSPQRVQTIRNVINVYHMYRCREHFFVADDSLPLAYYLVDRSAIIDNPFGGPQKQEIEALLYTVNRACILFRTGDLERQKALFRAHLTNHGETLSKFQAVHEQYSQDYYLVRYPPASRYTVHLGEGIYLLFIDKTAGKT